MGSALFICHSQVSIVKKCDVFVKLAWEQAVNDVAW